jgi:predicted transposase YdaD
MEQLNDISFTVDNRLVVLIEHQSTINPNMPLRLLMYIARIYEKITERRKLYQTRLEKIPAPEFIVLYNGLSDYPDHKVLKLSDAFKDANSLKSETSPESALELTVNVYNINKGHSAEIVENSETLNGYCFFIDKIREYRKSLSYEEAMKAAIKYCIDHNILKYFFETHSTEVFNMLITEWDTEEAKQVWYEEGLEEGLEKGLEKGREEGLEEGLEKGRLDKELEIARNAMSNNLPLELIHKLTELDMGTLKSLESDLKG